MIPVVSRHSVLVYSAGASDGHPWFFDGGRHFLRQRELLEPAWRRALKKYHGYPKTLQTARLIAWMFDRHIDRLFEHGVIYWGHHGKMCFAGERLGPTHASGTWAEFPKIAFARGAQEG